MSGALRGCPGQKVPDSVGQAGRGRLYEDLRPRYATDERQRVRAVRHRLSGRAARRTRRRRQSGRQSRPNKLATSFYST